MYRINKLKSLLLIVSLMIGFSACGWSPSSKVAEEISTRFQITPSWEAIRSHLFYNEFKPGMTRAEIHKVLDKVGPWTTDLVDSIPGWDSTANEWVYREDIHFTEESTLQALGYWGFTYTKSDVLVHRERFDMP